MTQLVNLSSESKNILTGLYNKIRRKSLFNDADKQIIVSLYETMPFADAKVLNLLREYQIPLSTFLTGEELACLQQEYAAVISYCFYNSDINPNGIIHSKEGMLHLPYSIAELCMEMVGETAGKSVFLPYSGEGSFALHCQDAKVSGFELHKSYWAMAQILASTITEPSGIHLLNIEDEFEYHVQPVQYDLIFSFPPILSGRDGRKVIDTFHGIITKQLKEGGELYAVLPARFCSESSGWFDVRKILLDYHGQYSVLVVSLPPVLQPASSVPFCLVNFVKDGRGLVCLADASGFEFLSDHNIAGMHVFDMNVQSILEVIKKQDEKHVWVGTVDDLNSSLDLNPARYLLEQNVPENYDGHKTVRIGELVKILPLGRNPQTGNGTPLLGMKELSFKYLNCDIAYSSIPIKQEHYARFLGTDALLAGFIGGKFKVGRINGLHSGKGVSLRSEVHPFRIISKDVTEDYLLRSILSEFAERQARSLCSGVTITRLSKEDFLNIRIALPTIEEQEAICKEDTRATISESDRKVIESFEEFRKDMHMKKHAIGQTLFNLNNWWDALQQAREEGNGVVSDDATTGRIRKVTVATIYDSMQKAINQLQQQINKFDRGNGLEVKKFALTEFIEDYITRKQSPLFSFLYDASSHHASQTLPEVEYDETTGEARDTGKVILNEGDPIEYVDFAPEALEIIFDNIVSNACCHGFIDRPNNIIKIELTSDGDNFVILVSNNGSPIHVQIKPEEVFVYGKTSKMGKGSENGETHFGIGGYEVQKLMREFGGNAEFISDPESDFPVSYKLTFFNTNFESVEL